MRDIKYYQKVIQDKRKQSSFRDFLMDVCSWYGLSLYSNKGNISKFPDTARIKGVISNTEFEKSRDSLWDMGLDYDEKMSFFEQFKNLFQSIDMFSNCHYGQNTNSTFGESVLNGNNIYLTFAAISDCENVFYSVSIKDDCSDIFNSLMVQQHAENIYFCRDISSSYQVFYSRFIQNSNNVWFSTNLVWCSECIECDNLNNMSYCINNKQYSQQQYWEKKQQILSDKESFLARYNKLPQQGNNIWCDNVDWNALFNCFDVDNASHSYNVKNGSNLVFCGWALGVEDAYDICWGGSPSGHDMYAVAWASGSHIYCSSHILGSHVFYSYFLEWCSHCIGCVGLKNKQYCILNKQYEKQEYEILADQVFSKMEQNWDLWKPFPWAMNPFYFNDTTANMLGDFNQEEVEARWYMWRQEEIKTDIPKWADIVQVDELNKYQWYDQNKDWKINPEILEKVIVDDSWNYYRIVQMEYDFLLKYSLPLPEIHWMDRMKLNFWM